MQASKRSRSINKPLRDTQQEDELAFSVESAHKPSLFNRNGEELYDNRVLRCLVISPAGRPIYKYESPLELLMALRDAIKAHRSLYLDGNILHRDISENNIIITDPDNADGHSGMLIDLDLAKEVGSGRSGARHQTGTMEFMAIEVLLNIDHTYRHDLESFFYVLIWQCARHGWGKNNHPKDSKLRAWYTGNYEDIANAKLGHMSKAENMGFGFILREFPPKFRGVLPLCGALRDILFPYNDKGLIVGTPQDPNRLYDPIIKAYDDTIAQFELDHGWQFKPPQTSHQERPESSMLKKWYTGNYEEIATYKRGNMESGGFERILMKEFPPWFDWVKPLCRTIRRILFPHGEEGLIVGTPQDPKRLYNPIIKAYDDAIALIEPNRFNDCYVLANK
ncbi:hypothetical protein EMCG_05627 [[Emmonsia] crescens]|uniref:EKC/KEOPS complex subunit BUD32 n=1 Tax=[Emmonsia] crescens TaxID=73230 RepID=A0A0G2IDW9_9EURO|nr:hypothetical protein EMCG_05627 [Emmonsia crescens UAMH 3008]